MDQTVRVGVITDSLLQQHLLDAVLSEAGYEVGINIHPNKLNPILLQSETISMWVVDIMDDEINDHFLNDLFEHAVAPSFFGEGISPDRQSDEFVGWRRRLVTKLTELTPPIKPKIAPQVDLSDFATLPTPIQVIPLPESLGMASQSVDQVWIIAASLGGPKPVKAFFDSLPSGIPVAFLYAQHIDGAHVDVLVKSIGRHTALEMSLAKHGDTIQNGKVLVVPVDHEIGFTLTQRVDIKENGWSGPYGPSIDHLVHNVVSRFGAKTNLIIFSGMGSDGTLGATLLKESGGQIWSQSSDSAIQSSMPDSAAEAGCVSYRDTPEGLAKRLLVQLSQQNAPPSAALKVGL